MEILFDTADLDFIKRYQEVITITGITTNPTVLKNDKIIDFKNSMIDIKKETEGKQLHIQVVGPTYELMKQDAKKIIKFFGDETFIKIPVNEPGLRLLKELHETGYNTTATSIYTQLQGILAIENGASYIAPYYNRMANNGNESALIISYLRQYIDLHKKNTKIVSASFKTLDQVVSAVNSGTHAITLNQNTIKLLLTNNNVDMAIQNFSTDWYDSFKHKNI